MDGKRFRIVAPQGLKMPAAFVCLFVCLLVGWLVVWLVGLLIRVRALRLLGRSHFHLVKVGKLGNRSFGYKAADGVTLDTMAPSNTKNRLQCVEGTPTYIVIFTPRLRDNLFAGRLCLVGGSWQ